MCYCKIKCNDVDEYDISWCAIMFWYKKVKFKFYLIEDLFKKNLTHHISELFSIFVLQKMWRSIDNFKKMQLLISKMFGQKNMIWLPKICLQKILEFIFVVIILT